MWREAKDAVVRGRNSIVNGRAVALFPVKPCGLPGRLGLGTYPRFRIASGPFPADDQVLRVTGSPSLPREASCQVLRPHPIYPALKGLQLDMQQTAQLSRQVDWLRARGFDPVRAQRLAFVRWSMLEGYAQFSEFITSGDPVIETRPGFKTGGQGAVTGTDRKEGSAA